MKVYQQIFHYFQVYKRYIGRRLYIVFGLMALASVTEAIGITMMLPLISTNLNIADIARQSGFANVRYMTKVFREAIGTTPSGFPPGRKHAPVADPVRQPPNPGLIHSRCSTRPPEVCSGPEECEKSGYSSF